MEENKRVNYGKLKTKFKNFWERLSLDDKKSFIQELIKVKKYVYGDLQYISVIDYAKYHNKVIIEIGIHISYENEMVKILKNFNEIDSVKLLKLYNKKNYEKIKEMIASEFLVMFDNYLIEINNSLELFDDGIYFDMNDVNDDSSTNEPYKALSIEMKSMNAGMKTKMKKFKKRKTRRKIITCKKQNIKLSMGKRKEISKDL